MTVVTGIGLGRIVGRLNHHGLHIFSGQFYSSEDAFLQSLIKRIAGQVVDGMGHNVFRELFRFHAMARRAILWADHHMDLVSVVLKGVRMGFGSLGMALRASHDFIGQIFWDFLARHSSCQALYGQCRPGRHPGMPAVPPALDDPRMKGRVASQTFGRGVAHRHFRRR